MGGLRRWHPGTTLEPEPIRNTQTSLPGVTVVPRVSRLCRAVFRDQWGSACEYLTLKRGRCPNRGDGRSRPSRRLGHPGPRRRADTRPAARRHPGRREQLVGRDPDPGAELPRAGPGPARARSRPTGPGAVPAGGLCGRRRRRGPGAGHGPRDRRRLLDGRHDRADVLAPAPGADGGARALRDGPQRVGLLPRAADGDDDAVPRRRVGGIPSSSRCARTWWAAACSATGSTPASAGPRSPACGACRWSPRSPPCRRCVSSARTGGSAASTSPRGAGHPARHVSCRRAARCAWPARFPAARVVEVDGDHDVFLAAPGAFAHALAAACLAVVTARDRRPGGTERAS